MLKKMITCLLFFGGLCSVMTHSVAAESLVGTGDKIVFAGDNVVFFGKYYPTGFINLIDKAFKVNGFDVSVISIGKGGNKSPQILENLKQEVIAVKPNWLFLNCGLSELHSLSAAEYNRNMEAIIQKAQDANIRVVLLTTTIMGEDAPNTVNQKRADFNETIRKLAKNKGCLLIDLDVAMSDALSEYRKLYPGYNGRIFTSDGFLLSPIGDKLVAETILNSLGMNEAQMSAAKKSWENLYWYVGGCRLTVKEYQMLMRKNIKANKNISDYIRGIIIRDISLECNKNIKGGR